MRRGCGCRPAEKEGSLAEVVVCGRCGTRSWAGVKFCYACGGSLTPGWPGGAPAVQAAAPVVQPPIVQPPVVQAQPIASVQPAVPDAPQAAQPWPGNAAPGQYPASAPYAPPSPYAAPQSAQPGSYSAGFSIDPFVASLSAKPVGLLFVVAVEIVIALVGFFVAYDLLRWVYWGLNYSYYDEVPLDAVVGVAYFATSWLMMGAARGLWSQRAWAWTRACLLNVVLLGMIIGSVIPWGLNTLDIIGIVANSVMLVCLNLTSTRKLFGRGPLAFLQTGQG